MLLLENSSVGFSGRSPVLAFQVTKVLATPLTVPAPPVAAVASPTRKGTIWVSWAAELMPVASAAVVPVRLGAELIIMRPTLAREAVSLPRLVPLTNAVVEFKFPRLKAVRVATFVPPKATVRVPGPTLMPATVSVELVAA